MSKIVWDGVGKKRYETGLRNGVLYPVQSNGSYGTGVAWNGLTSVNESPEGAELTELYADDGKYASLRSAENFKGTIEAYTFPDEFAACDGSAAVMTGVYLGQQSRSSFGLVYRTGIGDDTSADYDSHYKLHIVYGCTCSPSEKSYQSINDSPEAITLSWEFDSVPVNVTDHKATSLIVVDSTKCSSTGLAALEDALFGTDNTEPRLPLPDEVLTLLATTPEEDDEGDNDP